MVRTGLYRKAGEAAERTPTGPETDAQGIAQKTGGSVVAEVVGRGSAEGCLPHVLVARQKSGDVVLPTSKRAHDDEVGITAG